MNQRSLASLIFESKKKPTRRELFLGDDDANQTGQMLAALWDRPQATARLMPFKAMCCNISS